LQMMRVHFIVAIEIVHVAAPRLAQAVVASGSPFGTGLHKHSNPGVAQGQFLRYGQGLVLAAVINQQQLKIALLLL